MNRPFLVFAGFETEPANGWEAYLDSYHTLADAEQSLNDEDYTWWHIVDIRTMKIVKGLN